MRSFPVLCLLIVLGTTSVAWSAEAVTSVEQLVAAINEGDEGDTITIAPGEFRITHPLRPKAGMTIRGAGADKTRITNAVSWKVGIDGKPEDEINFKTANRGAYLIDLGVGNDDLTLANLSLRGAELHGGVFVAKSKNLHIHNCHFEDFLWSGLRGFAITAAKIHDNEFVDAGGRTKITKGITGGCIFLSFPQDSEIINNRFRKTEDHPGGVFGIKGRKATNLKICNNTIKTNFAIEFPFENDANVEICNNYLGGAVSIPKYAGGPIPADGFTFHIHHNYFTRTYSIEGTRNGLIVEYNLFDFKLDDDGGNLISSFGKAPAGGWVIFRDNLIKNPGRGVIWNNPVYNDILIENNHIVGSKTKTPRSDGLFGMHAQTDYSTVTIRNNIVELQGHPRPLLRRPESYRAVIKNNRLVGVSDVDQLENPATEAKQGPRKPLKFPVGVHNEFQVDGFSITRSE